MADRIEISISKETLKETLKRYFFNSLDKYPERYVPLFFANEIELVPNHISYLCPLCLTNQFVIIEGVGNICTSDFNPDHFPPESIGGKNKILVCKPCNNKAGVEFDFAMKEHFEFQCFQRKVPNAEKKVRASIEGLKGNFKAIMNIDSKGGTEFSLNPTKKNEYLERWQNRPDSKKATITFTINKYEQADDNKVQKAFLKAAYLYCFTTWGYDFIFSKNAEQFRKVINGELEYPLKTPTFWIDDIVLPEGVCMIQFPKELQTHVVNIPLMSKKLNYKAIATIILPPNTEDGWSKLVEFDKFLSTMTVTDFCFEKIESFI